MRSSLRRSIAPLALVAVLTVMSVLSGCSNAHDKAAAPSESVSVAASPTEAITEAFTIPPIKELYPHPKPEMPALAKEHSKEGAMAFAEYFVEASSYSLLAQDKEFFSKYCAEGSSYCQSQLKAIDEAVATNSYLNGVYFHDLRTTGVLVGGADPRVEWGVQVIGLADDYEVVYSEGSRTRSVKGIKFVSGTELFGTMGGK